MQSLSGQREKYKEFEEALIMKLWAKKMTVAAAVFALAAAGLSGCRSGGTQEGSKSEPGSGEEKVKVVSTVFAPYDWVRQVAGERSGQMDLTLLTSNGIDMHSYRPTAEDIAKIAKCDVFIYVGGESDQWVADALKTNPNPDRKEINLLESLGNKAKVQEVVEGMEDDEHDHVDGEEEHDGGDEDHANGEEKHDDADEDDMSGEDGHDDEHEQELDEHVWLSLRNAQFFVAEIADALEKRDEKNKQIYEMNADAYIKELDQLDSEYKKVTEDAPKKTVLFADRFPFRYLTDDYGLDYYAAFVGCSAETEASFETVTFLSEQVDKLGLGYVLTIENGNNKIADTVVESTEGKDQKIMVLNSMQSVTKEDIEKGLTYLSVMKDNLGVLEQVLR